MLEEMVLSLQSENKIGLKPSNNLPLRKSLLIQSQDVATFQNNKSLSFFFNTLDEGKIS